MAICPDHGAYTGDSCKKCQEPVVGRLGPVPPVDAELKATLTELHGLPKLDESDKLTLVKLENASLKSFHAMQNAQGQFQNFAKVMFEKYKVKPAECTLDMEKLEFVTRSM